MRAHYCVHHRLKCARLTQIKILLSTNETMSNLTRLRNESVIFFLFRHRRFSWTRAGQRENRVEGVPIRSSFVVRTHYACDVYAVRSDLLDNKPISFFSFNTQHNDYDYKFFFFFFLMFIIIFVIFRLCCIEMFICQSATTQISIFDRLLLFYNISYKYSKVYCCVCTAWWPVRWNSLLTTQRIQRGKFSVLCQTMSVFLLESWVTAYALPNLYSSAKLTPNNGIFVDNFPSPAWIIVRESTRIGMRIRQNGAKIPQLSREFCES